MTGLFEFLSFIQLDLFKSFGSQIIPHDPSNKLRQVNEMKIVPGVFGASFFKAQALVRASASARSSSMWKNFEATQTVHLFGLNFATRARMREIETEKDLAVAVIFVHSKPMLNAEFWNLGQFGVYWFSHVVKRRSPKNDSGRSENACKSEKP